MGCVDHQEKLVKLLETAEGLGLDKVKLQDLLMELPTLRDGKIGVR